LEEIALLKRMNKADNYEFSPVYIESFYFKEHYVIITSLHGDSLYRVMKNYNPKGFPLPVVRVIARDIISAINLMHTKGNMAHTDLKVRPESDPGTCFLIS
jgi:serine/threonine protein kinase